MTLLDIAKREQHKWNIIVEFLESVQIKAKINNKRKAILKSVSTTKGKSFKGKHWMQLPENRARVMKAIRKMQDARRKK